MPQVKFTKNLQRFFPKLDTIEVEGQTVAEIIHSLNAHFPGLSTYIIDDHNALRQHVNIFVGEELIRDREKLSDRVEKNDRVYILQALSGGSAPLWDDWA